MQTYIKSARDGGLSDQEISSYVTSKGDMQLTQTFLKAKQSIDRPQNGGGLIEGIVKGPSSDMLEKYKSSVNDPSVGGFTKNVALSGAQTVGGIANALLHPIKTAKTIYNIAEGGLEKGASAIGLLKPESQDKEAVQTFDAVVEFFKNRYGGIDQFKKTAYEDPVGFVADIASILTGGGGAASKVGQVSKIGELSRFGSTLTKVGNAIEPTSKIVGATKSVLGAAGNATKRVVGETLGLSSGAGFGSVKHAFENPSEAFVKAMRGEVSADAIVDEARNALDSIKQSRSASYKEKLAEVSKNTTEFTDKFTAVKVKAQSLLKQFNISVLEDGGLDFSRSTIRSITDQNEVKSVIGDIENWGREAGDLTPVGLDILKRRLGEFISPSSSARAIVTGLKNEVDGILKNNVKGYSEMVKGYENASAVIDDIQRGLSLGDSASIDTAFKKLSSALRENQDYRRELVSQLEAYGGKDLTAKIAGGTFNQLMPRGLVAKIGAGGAALNAFSHPMILVGLAFASPRLVGELLHAMGWTAQQVKILNEYLPSIQKNAKALFQAGRLNGVSEKEDQK